MSVEQEARKEFEWYTRSQSVFDQYSWRLRPDHVQANGMMTREELKELCWHFYVYGMSDSTKIKQRVLDNKTSKESGSQ